MAYGEIPRGLADLQVAPLTGETPGTWVDVPGARTLSFNTESDSDELEGDNTVIAKVRNPKSLSGSIEIGKINLAALAVMLGGAVTTDGDTPNEITELDELDTTDVAYYAIAGQAPGVDAAGSAYRVLIHKALTTSGLDESMTVNDWNTPTLDFEALSVMKDGDKVLLTRQQYETAVALPPAAP